MRFTTACGLLATALLMAFAAPAHSADTPRNVIVLIADGWGFNQKDTVSLYQKGITGTQVYEDFPVSLAMSTFPDGGSYDPDKAWSEFDYVHGGATDSAAAATAMSTGHKTYNGAIGLDPDKKPLKNVVQHAEENRKMTGVVSSVQWTHATPAGFVAHNESRGNMNEIGREMIMDSAVDVIMGTGHPAYDDDGKRVDELKYFGQVGGRETWDALQAGTAGGDADGDGKDDKWTLIETREDFQKLAEGDTPERVIGVAQAAQTIQMKRGNKNDVPFATGRNLTVPTLAEMTRGALNVLDNDPDGFFLMVEGGAVDWAGHENWPARMIEEGIGFNLTVEAVVNWVEDNSNWEETLVIVTADHETGYLTGPNSKPDHNPLELATFGVMPGHQWHSGGHTNQLVPFFAKGNGSDLFAEAATGNDPVRGAYLDNTDLGGILVKLHRHKTTVMAK